MNKILRTDRARTTILIRLMVGVVFLSEGIQKFLFPELPGVLKKVHPVHKVPHVGIFVSGGIVILLSIFGTQEFIVSAASFTILLCYSITNIAAIRMHKEHKLYPN